MRSLLKSALEKAGLYERFRYSWMFESIQNLRRPDLQKHRQDQLAFYRKVLRTPRVSRVFDIGANIGDKTDLFLRFADHVVSVEPDPTACQKLKNRFGHRASCTLVSAAVGEAEGSAELLRADVANAFNSLSTKHCEQHQLSNLQKVKVDVVTLNSLISRFGMPDFTKIDVEGFEKQVFLGLSKPLPVVCFEANLSAFLDETLFILNRLQGLSPDYEFNLIVNDGSTDFVFPQWQTQLQAIQEYLSSIRQGSVDVYARFRSP